MINKLKAYIPFNEQERVDIAEIIRRLESGEELYSRENLSAHFTASAWVISPDRSQLLMAYHNLYDSWAWLGGHADGEKDLLKVAIKEVQEESGLVDVYPVLDEIYSVEIIGVDGHFKKGKYVPSHLHLNVTYLLEADPSQEVKHKPDENKDVKWFGLDEAIDASNEVWFRENIYNKLNEKISTLK